MHSAISILNFQCEVHKYYALTVVAANQRSTSNNNFLVPMTQGVDTIIYSVAQGLKFKSYFVVCINIISSFNPNNNNNFHYNTAQNVIFLKAPRKITWQKKYITCRKSCIFNRKIVKRQREKKNETSEKKQWDIIVFLINPEQGRFPTVYTRCIIRTISVCSCSGRG